MAEMAATDANHRIAYALTIAQQASASGESHKQWVIDRMVRALTGCILSVTAHTTDYGRAYTTTTSQESDEYRAWVAACTAGVDGPETYLWDTGIAP